jgi:hypothetical protein
MKPTRKTQPYRKGPRTPGIVLTNMKRGRTLFGQHPSDGARKAMKRRKRRLRVKPRRTRL